MKGSFILLFDTHIHSEFSFDSSLKVEDILEKKANLQIGITLTEHVDLDIPELPVIDVSSYLNFYDEYRSDSFLLGLEIGLSSYAIDKINSFANKNSDSLDIIIGSIHSVDNKDLFYSMREDNLCKHDIYEKYLNTMLFCVRKFDFFDTLAHIDYICRYAKFIDTQLYLHEFPELIDEILKTLIAKNKCLELNTRRLSSENAFSSLLDIYNRYKILGGKYVTIASDSHNKDNIGANFDLAKNFLKLTNLQSVYFKNRQLIVYDI